jgi:hypothetical protein
MPNENNPQSGESKVIARSTLDMLADTIGENLVLHSTIELLRAQIVDLKAAALLWAMKDTPIEDEGEAGWRSGLNSTL